MKIRKRDGLPPTTLHVMNRGARKLSIYLDDDDRRLFIRLVARFARKYHVLIISLSLMPNHFHLELHGEGTAIWKMLRDLTGTYSRAFNERHGTQGCLVQGTFQATLIESPEGRAYVSRYIHLNCRDLGIAPEDYPWSTCRSYLGLDPVPSWLSPEPVLDVWKGSNRTPQEEYRDYLKAAPPPKVKRREDEYANFNVEFLRHLEEKCAERLVGRNGQLGRVSLQTVVCWAARTIHGIPSSVVAAYYGFASADSINTRVSRFQKRVRSDQVLRAYLESVKFTVTQ